MDPLPKNPEVPPEPPGTAFRETALPQADPWADRVLDDRYRITERLGEGGMGAVFVAEHLKLHKPVAIKVIRAELAGNGEVAARFAREAMATAQFEHPHVASAIDYGTLPEGGAYLVMQLVRGRSLREILTERGRLPWPEACELLAQIADALSAARGAGIVHRDLKPENILVETREDGSQLAKILDFGIAHIAPPAERGVSGGAPTRELTRVGTVMGTPGYMSPEQAVGDKVDHRTDIYALGVVLWECLCGQALWDGPDVTSIIARQMRDPVPLLRQRVADASLPHALDEFVQQLCARSADARPDHAGTVRDTLRGLVAQHRRRASLAQTARHFVERALHGRADARHIGAAAVVLSALALALVLTRSAAPAGGTASTEPEAAPPAELSAEITALLEGPRAADRRKAAQTLLAYTQPQRIAAHLLAIAKFESARGCRERKDALAALGELGDARALPALQRVANSSKSGCGFLDLEDCNACIRGDLRRVIDQLTTKALKAAR